MVKEIDYSDPAIIEWIQMNPTYENCVDPNIDKFMLVTLDDDKVNEIENVISSISEKKRQESGHQVDNKSEEKRWRNGLGGEAAVEKLLNIKFSDTSVGDSKSYNIADLSVIGLNCGVKTVEYGNFPLVHTIAKRPEIIVIKKDDKNFYVCGVGDEVSLTYYTNPKLILDPILRNMNKKTGFWGIHRLKQFSNLDELKEILR